MQLMQKTIEMKQIKKQVANQLAVCGIDDKSEAEWLIACVLGTRRTNLALIKSVNKKQAKKILKATKKRCKGMPIDIIFGHTQFFGHKFFVNRHVLCPRPETELLTEWAIKWAKEHNANSMLDMCTGSGAIAISAKLALPKVSVVGADISKKALKTAKKNAKNLGAQVVFVHSNMFKNIQGHFDILVCNPPYIATEQLKQLDKEVQNYDPQKALDGGVDGLDFYRLIAVEAPKHLNAGAAIGLEVGFNQAEQVAKMLETNFENIEILFDYNHIARMVVATKRLTHD